jgi:hypothetical protein
MFASNPNPNKREVKGHQITVRVIMTFKSKGIKIIRLGENQDMLRSSFYKMFDMGRWSFAEAIRANYLCCRKIFRSMIRGALTVSKSPTAVR